jgi:hypothetical protein
MTSRSQVRFAIGGVIVVLLVLFAEAIYAQSPRTQKIKLGSETARNGFKNEDEIAAKFNNWKIDTDAQNWLNAMGYKAEDIQSVSASKPHGEKADVELRLELIEKENLPQGRKDAKQAEYVEGISIKLVSSPNGFNQIDKRWLSHYARMWKMPAEVEQTLKLFVGENPPIKSGRAANRMFLDELDVTAQRAVTSFFETHKHDIVSDLFQGDGVHAAGWVMVAFKATANTRWTIRRVDDVVRFYSEGPVKITFGGNLKVGRITMQRKGGDGGRDTAKMLQFKINPVEILYEK